MTMSRKRFIAAATVPFAFAATPLLAFAVMLANPSDPAPSGEAVTIIIDTRGADAAERPAKAMSYSGAPADCPRDGTTAGFDS
jgi:hypothetical protein